MNAIICKKYYIWIDQIHHSPRKTDCFSIDIEVNKVDTPQDFEILEHDVVMIAGERNLTSSRAKVYDLFIGHSCERKI